MSILDSIFSLLAISSSILGLLASIVSTFVIRQLSQKQRDDEKDIHIKVNDREITLKGYDEKEVIQLLEELNHKKKQVYHFKPIEPSEANENNEFYSK